MDGRGSVGGLSVTNVLPHVGLKRLRDGNQRFASGNTRQNARFDRTCDSRPVAEQAPYAIVLGCSDSRVPADTIFDQDLGELFVVRVAGNIAIASQIGSVELAAERFGARLVVVLGHSECGAVRAALEQVESPAPPRSPHLESIMAFLQPAVGALRELDCRPTRDELMRLAVRANVLAAVNHLKHSSNILARLIEGDGLVIVGAEYSLRTGTVLFLEELHGSDDYPSHNAIDNACKESLS